MEQFARVGEGCLLFSFDAPLQWSLSLLAGHCSYAGAAARPWPLYHQAPSFLNLCTSSTGLTYSMKITLRPHETASIWGYLMQVSRSFVDAIRIK